MLLIKDSAELTPLHVVEWCRLTPSHPRVKMPGIKLSIIKCTNINMTNRFQFLLSTCAATTWRRCGATPSAARSYWRQGLTLVPIPGQLELFCPPHNPA
jgi:hypothetical protein